MVLLTSILIGALGAMARFEAAAEVAGFKMHALGVTLMVFAFIGIVASFRPDAWLRRRRSSAASPAAATA
ncbi:MAG: hypothetical protein Q8K63_07445 [Acidimicrobiales bacterium]|nr:hypothetical protein [Acidimicrobiales bacterium]